MSSDSIHIIITIGIVILMFSWVPFVNIVCPPGWRSVEPSEEKEGEKRQQKASLSPRSSRRAANQSQEILRALSTRGERRIPRSEAAAPPPSSCAE
jgi:hypothetical protein